MDELQLLKQDAQQQNAPMQVQQNAPQQLQRPEYNTDFMHRSIQSWEIVSMDEVAVSEIEAETRYDFPAVSEERKIEMKNFLKAKSDIRKKLSTTSLLHMATWGQASKNIDGAGAEYAKMSDTLYSFYVSYTKYENASEDKKNDAELEKNDEAVNMLRAAQKYIALHGREHQFTDKGKNRMAIARYIVSREFMTKYLVADTAQRAFGEAYLSNVYDADSFIFEHMYRKANIKTCEEVKKEEVKAVTRKFAVKYSSDKKDSRSQFAVLFGADKIQSEKIIDAMKMATGDEPDLTGMYKILDEKVNDILKFTITPEMFTKKYIVNNTTFLAHINSLSLIAADFFGPNNCLYGSIGAKYLEVLRKNHPEVAEVLEAKAQLISDYGMVISDAVIKQLGVSMNNIRQGILSSRTDYANVRTYDIDRDEFEEVEPVTIEDFKNIPRKVKVDEKYFTATYNFNRVRNKVRADEIMQAHFEKNKGAYDSEKEKNDGINEESLKFLDYMTSNDGRRMIEFYIPSDSLYYEKYLAAMKKDLNDTNLDRNVAGMLKLVKFDACGDPLPEYKENHQWNIHWVHSYAKALSYPDQRVPEYEECLKEMIDWVTSDENIKRVETICQSKSYEKNSDDYSFLVRMSEVSLKLFDNHMKNSKVANPLYTELGDKRDVLNTKMNYVSALINYYMLDLQIKHQIDFANVTFVKQKIDAGSPSYEQLQMAFKIMLDDATKEYKAIQ